MTYNFVKSTTTPNFEDHISKHANYIIKEIYHGENASTENKGSASNPILPKRIHGGIHASRMAILIPILANFFKDYTNEGAENLTLNEIKLLQIAALFESSSKENQKEQKHIYESAENCYDYLHKILNQEKEISIKISEAIANLHLGENKNKKE